MEKKMLDKAISVSQFNNYIKSIFESEVMLHGIKIFGEITDWQVVRDIAYFSIKDENALLSCVAFGASKFGKIENGAQVVLTGSPNYYVKGGRFNFSVSKIEPYGQGLLYAQFIALKNKLEAEGLFSESAKKTLPLNIKTIGVVTSETGAVIEDIINVSTRRNPSINIVVYPAKVQGEGAAKTVIEGIEFFDNYDKVDVIVVARGGGSMEDLWAFNDEQLAREVFACNKFVLSAVGHETDFTIIDFVADLRTPTPSAAAELLTQDNNAVLDKFLSLSNRMNNSMRNVLANNENKLRLLDAKFENAGTKFVSNFENKLNLLKPALLRAVNSYINQKDYELGFVEKSIVNLNPKAVLQRGFAKLEQNNKSITSVNSLEKDQNFTVILSDGQIRAKSVEEKHGF
jgi:exodeoxyribonuclease VII large subunit